MSLQTLRRIEPLVKIEGGQYLADLPSPSHYVATCRDCGVLTPAGPPQTLQQASLQQARHLAEHLTALAAEITEAAR